VRPEVQNAWLHDVEPCEEYLIKVVTARGVHVAIEEAMRVAVQLINDVATEHGIACSAVVGRVDPEVSYTPRPSMTAHIILNETDNGVEVAKLAAETFYVKE
jgi:hypothetical protein